MVYSGEARKPWPCGLWESEHVPSEARLLVSANVAEVVSKSSTGLVYGNSYKVAKAETYFAEHGAPTSLPQSEVPLLKLGTFS